MVKNHGLTPLLFAEIFRVQKLFDILALNDSNRWKVKFLRANYHILTFFL